MYDKYIKWYDYLWLLIPIAGLAGFVLAVKERAKKEIQKEKDRCAV